MNSTYELDDWRDVGRILGLLHRFGCRLERLEVSETGGTFRTSIDFHGESDAVRRLSGQIHRILTDAKEMKQ